MKILHTSDWHLGQNFYNKSRKNEHERFLQWLLEQVIDHDIDAIIVAGDIFDTSTPPSYAREMYNKFVVDSNKIGCQLVLLGGNHDSVSVLKETQQLLKYMGADVIPNTNEDHATQVVELKGKKGDVEALVCAIPFIRPRDVLTSQAGVTGVARQKQLGDAIKQHYQSVYDAAVEKRATFENSEHMPIIATGHLTAMGVQQSDSVRDIYVGNLDGFAADGFPDADYIALGHIHRPQVVAKREYIRYCGSPIPLSFDELKSQKQVCVVEFVEGVRTISQLAVPTFQPLAEIKGDLSEIESQLNQYIGLDGELSVWLSIEVQAQDYLSDLQERMRTLTEGLNVEVLQLRRARERRNQALGQESAETLSELSPMDVFSKRIALEEFETDSEKARLERMTVKFKQVMVEVSESAQAPNKVEE
ncbi:ATP dependent, structure specific DNA nuclease -SbcD subunit [Vibrio crassostreae]|uniref:exonuclease subunit SbcD n=1 Tax=Vibrio crassostreae TaxID=246167 RepID=UPI001B308B60|nr:exonuclease subunit SbcD [Vibrio crassostreae]CAK1840101.1 ATP dependent, structure specific DNA nuclease -SbcD subunit [Vibrio crassostreae]CAK1842440.1 ATP dependent, structure specific DNA nuclease -SbcD subunit [Vibrio crassostreae]CAK1844887.1 ATP dependent, structure specific DNA nuclease -SbcD subunit [Vibrio crassostreae]CAK1849281.1 ATP dependent, structure specific DNA nuclease -SbcD subunit [Vibrio crassostreae]CAK1852952.1 ATP dependent, structure specific DNA nuclease -SbcD sub